MFYTTAVQYSGTPEGVLWFKNEILPETPIVSYQSPKSINSNFHPPPQ